jgi:uncharacterized protein (DUF305 family)
MNILLIILTIIITSIACLLLLMPYFNYNETDKQKHKQTQKQTHKQTQKQPQEYTMNHNSVSPCGENLTDKEFIDHMIPHHEVAVYMSEQLLNKTHNPIILNIVRNIIRIQTYEIAMMKDYMTTDNSNITDDMSNITIKMNTNYYSTQGDFTKPNTLELSNTYCDPSFFNITHALHEMTDTAYIKHMIPHHQVAVDMSKKILKTTKSDFIIYMAYRMIRAQQSEIVELENLLNSPYIYTSSIL